MSEDRLAKLLLEDRQARAERFKYIAPNCFACGRSYYPSVLVGDASTRFCGRTCREAYDAGYMPKPDLDPFSVKWADGVTVKRREEEEDLIRPRKLCVKCGARLPVWGKSRKVPSNRKYCQGCSR